MANWFTKLFNPLRPIHAPKSPVTFYICTNAGKVLARFHPTERDKGKTIHVYVEETGFYGGTVWMELSCMHGMLNLTGITLSDNYLHKGDRIDIANFNFADIPTPPKL